jgi:hypothetical protein
VQWQVWTNLEDQTPLIVSERERIKAEYIPAPGESALSPEWEAKIKPELRWWTDATFTEKQRLELINKAYNDLVTQGIIKGKLLEESRVAEKAGTFALRLRWWKGQTVVRDMPVEIYDLLIDTGKDHLDVWSFDKNPLLNPAVSGAYKTYNVSTPAGDNYKGWLKWEGDIEPKDARRGNPNERIPAHIKILDSGRLELFEDKDIFKSFKFAGDKLKGYYTMKTDPGSNLWDFKSSALPGKPKESVELYFKDGSSLSMDAGKLESMINAKLPVEIKYNEKGYAISSTKSGGLIMQKNNS